MATEYHYEGEVGTILELDAETDISAATVKRIDIKQPDGVIIESPASFVGTNKLQVTLPTLIAGIYIAQIYTDLPTPWQGHGRSFTFEVFNLFGTPD